MFHALARLSPTVPQIGRRPGRLTRATPTPYGGPICVPTVPEIRRRPGRPTQATPTSYGGPICVPMVPNLPSSAPNRLSKT